MDLLHQLLKTGAGFASEACHCSAETRIVEAENEEPCEKLGSELYELTLEYRWAELSQATDRFCDLQVLSRGHTGTIYRAQLEEGVPVAIKVLKGPTDSGFTDEVRLLSRCHHPNVVMLLGYSIEMGGELARSALEHEAISTSNRRRALVYELLIGGSAFSRLQSGAYSWQHRLQTALQVSRGLAHLHKFRPELFHRDIKSSNILFTAEGVAKIADFGLVCASKFRSEQWSTVSVANGTPGYCAPEYARTNVVTEASEMYSMGMVLIELLTARPPAVLAPDGENFAFLLAEVRPDMAGAEERLADLLDPRADWQEECAVSLAELALKAIHDAPLRRPRFMELVVALQPLADAASRGAKPVAAAALPPQIFAETLGARRPEAAGVQASHQPEEPAEVAGEELPALVAMPMVPLMPATLQPGAPSEEASTQEASDCTSAGYHAASETPSTGGPGAGATTVGSGSGTPGGLFRWLSRRWTRQDLADGPDARASDNEEGQQDGMLQEALDGSWAHKSCPGIVEVIRGDTIHGRDGTLTSITAKGKDTLSIELNGSPYHATLVGDLLFWDDGDIWVRLGQGTESQDAAAAALAAEAFARDLDQGCADRAVSRSPPDTEVDPLIERNSFEDAGTSEAVESRSCRDVRAPGRGKSATEKSDAAGLLGAERYQRLHHISEMGF